MIDAYPKKHRKIATLPGGDIRLDAGCGTTKRPGFIGIDMYDYGQEIIWDLGDGVPLPDNSCIEIHTQHFLEHVPDMIGVMCEFWRVLKKGGKLTAIVPHKNDANALFPVHLRLMDEGTFRFFAGGNEFNELRRHGDEKWTILESTVTKRNDLIVIMSPIK